MCVSVCVHTACVSVCGVQFLTGQCDAAWKAAEEERKKREKEGWNLYGRCVVGMGDLRLGIWDYSIALTAQGEVCPKSGRKKL